MSEKLLSTLALLSQLWDGSKISRIRASLPPIVLRNRRLSSHLLIQPVVLASLLENDVVVQQGYLARCLTVMPKTKAGTRPYKKWVCSEDKNIKLFWKHLNELIRVPLKYDPSFGLVLRDLNLNPQSYHVWCGFHDEIELKLAPGNEYSSIRAFGSKAAEHTLRLAGILALFNNPHTTVIDEETMLNAISLMRFYLQENMRILNGGVLCNSMRDAQILLDWLNQKNHKEISIRTICQSGPNSLRRKEKAEKAVNTLVEYNWLVPIYPDQHPSKKEKSRRCAIKWRLNSSPSN